MKWTNIVATGLLGLTVGAPVAAQEAEKVLYFYNWTDYYPIELLDKFKTETGIEVILDGYDSNDTLIAKLQSGGANYDVIVPSGYLISGLVQDGLIQKINTAEMENFPTLRDSFKSPEFDPAREYTAPYLWGVTGIAYDSDVVPEAEMTDSWKEIFEPREEFIGNIAMLDIPADAISAASWYLGIPQCTESSEDAKRILEVLEAQKPKLKFYSADSTVDRMASGEVAMYMLWNGATARAAAQRESIRFIYPEEGTPQFTDNFAVPINAPHPENAKIFINWMMAPENAAAVSNAIAYANAVQSEEFMSDQWKNIEAINMPEEFSDRLRPTEDCSPTARDLRDKIWTRLKG
ncbi:extracellular solute-binding protein [Roseovarius aestuarii]|nr:extracellular solute-binding protein [Roseovarius aestuarii]